MRLVDELEQALAREGSMFRAQLLREDIARLRRLQAMAQRLDQKSFLEQGRRVGWTQGDARTAELREPLERLLDAVYALERGAAGAEGEARVGEAWNALHRTRMERLLGCLSTPVPKPAD